MKKMIALMIALMMGITLVACDEGKTDKKVSDSDVIAGGWTLPESPVVTDEVKTVLAKATDGLAGATYEPVAYLGSQVVAGTNHRILCKFTPSTKNAKTTYAIVTVYEDLEGKAEITGILNSEAEVQVTDEAIDGGWTLPESFEVTEDAASSLRKASENVVGASYHPVALLGIQVVAGTNYCLLCEITPVTENPESHYAVVVVYNGADGNTHVLETFDFTAEAE